MKKKILLVITALSLVILTACTAPVNETVQTTTTTTQPVSKTETTAPPPSTAKPETEAATAAPEPSSEPASKAPIKQTTIKEEPKTSAQPESTSEAAEISKEKAIEAALNHAKISPADAKFVKAEIDFDRGIKHYDVEFKSAGFEYDYEIDIETGKILKHEKEFDD